MRSEKPVRKQVGTSSLQNIAEEPKSAASNGKRSSDGGAGDKLSPLVTPEEEEEEQSYFHLGESQPSQVLALAELLEEDSDRSDEEEDSDDYDEDENDGGPLTRTQSRRS